MPVTVSLDPLVTIERVVFFMWDGPLPSTHMLQRAADRWAHELVAPDLAGPIWAWEAAHPLTSGIVRREDISDLQSAERIFGVLGFGPRETSRMRAASHALCVQGRTTACGAAGRGSLRIPAGSPVRSAG